MYLTLTALVPAYLPQAKTDPCSKAAGPIGEDVKVRPRLSPAIVLVGLISQTGCIIQLSHLLSYIINPPIHHLPFINIRGII